MVDRYLPELSESARRWLRFGLLVALLAVLCWIAYGLRSVFTPLLVSLAIAYVLNPIVSWLEGIRGVQRLQIVIVVFVLFLALFIVGGVYAVGGTVAQVRLFAERLPEYVDTIGEWLGALEFPDLFGAPAATQPAAEGATSTQAVTAGAGEAPSGVAATRPADDWWTHLAPMIEKHGVAVAQSTANYVVGLMSSVIGWVSLFVLIPLYTFFFLWRFNDMVTAAHDYLPTAYRAQVVYFAQTIDLAVSNFFRGRLVVCLLVGTLSGIGWSIVGVPYSLPLGALAGLLNLVPYMSMLALPPVLLFAYLGAAEAGQSWVWPVLSGMGVYMLVQALESFALSPLIEGRSSGLHPLAIVVAILIGGQLGGLLGMLLAIPVASTLRTFAAELLLPEIRRLAGKDNGQPPPGDAPQSAPQATASTNTDAAGPAPASDQTPDAEAKSGP